MTCLKNFKNLFFFFIIIFGLNSCSQLSERTQLKTDDQEVVRGGFVLTPEDWIWPVPVSQKILKSVDPVDSTTVKKASIKARVNSYVLNVYEGRVHSIVEKLDEFNKALIIEHPHSMYSIYGNLSEILVNPDQKVHQGQVLATLGPEIKESNEESIEFDNILIIGGHHKGELLFQIKKDQRAIDLKALYPISTESSKSN